MATATKAVLGIVPVLILSIVALVPSAAAQATRLEQTLPAVQSIRQSCFVGGNPDARACVSSDQDGVAPLGTPWIYATRANPALNWSFVYGVWSSNSSVFVEWTNVRSATIDLALNHPLHDVANLTEQAGTQFSVVMEADTPYVTINIEDIGPPETVTWRGQALDFRYDASWAGGTLTFTPTFTAGTLVIGFPSPGGGVPTMIPFLPGLTNFQQFDLIPDVGQIAAFSCGSVTLSDPRGPQAIAATRAWIFGWGDGSPDTRTFSPVAGHLYARPGVYNVTMTVQTADGVGIGYSGTVDTTDLSCAFHVARSVGFVVLTGATAALLAVSYLRPRLTKKERKRLRGRALGCAVAVLVLVVVL